MTMVYNKSLIGYELNYVRENFLKDSNKQLIVEISKTPLSFKIEERKNNEPVVVKHLEDDDRIFLTVSCFK
ncbi:MAG: hypothetical protein GX154_05185 [Clostridiales bacterium]|nr:hypothetical protein [Clostridiales bacterium]